MFVEARTLQDGQDHLGGVLRLVGAHIVAEPDTPLLRGILAQPACDYYSGQFYNAVDDPQQFLRCLHQQYRSAYLRASEVLDDGDGGEALARHYADHWNALVDHGEKIPAAEMEDAGGELERGQWRATHRPDGSWVAHRWDDAKPLRAWKRYAAPVAKKAEHAPKGGIYLVNMKGETKMYKGGQWIPASEIANLPPAEKARLHAAQQNAAAGRMAMGNIDSGKLQKKLVSHARNLTTDEKVRAANEFHALHGYHGELTLHRVAQLAKQQKDFLKRTNLTAQQRNKIKGNLARLHSMVGMAKTWGVSGKIAGSGERPAFHETVSRALKDQHDRESERDKGLEDARKLVMMDMIRHGENISARMKENYGPAYDKAKAAMDAEQTQRPGTPESVAVKDAGKQAEQAQTPKNAPMTPAAEKAASAQDHEQFNKASQQIIESDPDVKRLLDAGKADEARSHVFASMLRAGQTIPPSIMHKFADAYQAAQASVKKPTQESSAPMSPDEAASALAKQAGHEAQPKEGDDAASTLNRQLIAEGSDAAKPSGKKPEEEAFDAAWFKALAEDPISRKLIDKGKTQEARTRVLASLLREGVEIPKRIAEAFPQEYQSARAKVEKEPEVDPEERERLLQNRNAALYGLGPRQSKKKEAEDLRREWGQKAKDELGVSPKELHDVADQIEKESQEHSDSVRRLLADARNDLRQLGYDAGALTTNMRAGYVEDNIPGMGLVARTMANRYPGLFVDVDPDHPNYGTSQEGADARLGRYFIDGIPPVISRENAYEKAFEYIKDQVEGQHAHGEAHAARNEREPGEDDENDERASSEEHENWLDDEDDPFAVRDDDLVWKSLRRWIRKGRRRETVGQRHLFDTSKHPHAPAGSPHGGQFVEVHTEITPAEDTTRNVADATRNVASALARYANRSQTAQGGGLFGGEDLQARRGFAKLPDGTPIVFTQGEFKGLVGKIVRDTDAATSAPRVIAEVDGRPGLIPISPDAIEPLQEIHSWRTQGGGSGHEETQGGLFSADHFLPARPDLGDVAEAKNYPPADEKRNAEKIVDKDLQIPKRGNVTGHFYDDSGRSYRVDAKGRAFVCPQFVFEAHDAHEVPLEELRATLSAQLAALRRINIQHTRRFDVDAEDAARQIQHKFGVKARVHYPDDSSSRYVYVDLPAGGQFKIRFADHPQPVDYDPETGKVGLVGGYNQETNERHSAADASIEPEDKEGVAGALRSLRAILEAGKPGRVHKAYDAGDLIEKAGRIHAPGQADLPSANEEFNSKHPRRGKGPGGGEFAKKEEGDAEAGETPHAVQRSPAERQEQAQRDWKEHGVRSKSFKDWFGDWENDPQSASKVVNDKGEPQENYSMPGTGSVVTGEGGVPVAVYHGTSKGGFESFSKEKMSSESLLGRGFYFTTDKKIARSYRKKTDDAPPTLAHPLTATQIAAARSLFIRYRRRLEGQYSPEYIADVLRTQPGFPRERDIFNDLFTEESNEGIVRKIAKKVGVRYAFNPDAQLYSVYLNIRQPLDADHPSVELAQAFVHYNNRGIDDPDNKPYYEEALALAAAKPRAVLNFDTIALPETQKFLRSLGYDGITHIGGDRLGGGHHHRVWIVFEPEQIKSVNNSGTFDAKSANIYKSWSAYR